MDSIFISEDPTDYPGPILERGDSCNLNVHRILELKRKYGLESKDNPFVELPKRGASNEEMASMLLDHYY